MPTARAARATARQFGATSWVHTEQTGEGLDFGLCEPEEVGVDLDDLPCRSAAGECDRCWLPAGQHEVTVGREAGRDGAYQVLAGRLRGKLVEVVDDQTHVDRREVGERVDHPLGGAPRR